MTPFLAQFDIIPAPLSGMCRFRAQGGGLEVELMETGTCQRSVLYLRDGQDLVVFVPRGNYGMWLRQLDEAAVANLVVRMMTPWHRFGFFMRKSVSVFKRGPLASLHVLRDFWKRRGRLVAARTSARAGGNRAVTTTRVAVEPVEISGIPSVSIIIPTKVHADLLKACVETLDLIRGVRFELIVVDNGATEAEMVALLENLRQREGVRVLRLDIPFNFSRLCNAGAKLASHDFLLFLNDDIEALGEGWLGSMIGYAMRSDVGVVGARLLYPSGLLQHAGIASHLVPGPGHPFRLAPREIWLHEPLTSIAGEVDAVTGACLLIRRPLFEELGGFDEENFPISLNDVDLCLRVREQGLKIIYAPEATLIHKESQSRRDEDHPQEQVRRQRELMAYFHRHSVAARMSCYYPADLRRDSDAVLFL